MSTFKDRKDWMLRQIRTLKFWFIVAIVLLVAILTKVGYEYYDLSKSYDNAQGQFKACSDTLEKERKNPPMCTESNVPPPVKSADNVDWIGKWSSSQQELGACKANLEIAEKRCGAKAKDPKASKGHSSRGAGGGTHASAHAVAGNGSAHAVARADTAQASASASAGSVSAYAEAHADAPPPEKKECTTDCVPQEEFKIKETASRSDGRCVTATNVGYHIQIGKDKGSDRLVARLVDTSSRPIGSNSVYVGSEKVSGSCIADEQKLISNWNQVRGGLGLPSICDPVH